MAGSRGAQSEEFGIISQAFPERPMHFGARGWSFRENSRGEDVAVRTLMLSMIELTEFG